MFTKINKLKVLRLFLENQNSYFHLREIARLTYISPGGMFKILKKLEDEKLVIREKTKVMDNFIANVENKEYIAIKKAFNIYSIMGSGLIEFLVEAYSPKAIVLFGSYAKGEDTEKSDIDIAIITNKEKRLDISKYEEVLKRRINPLEIDIKKIKKEMKNNLVNGIVLYGYLEMF